VKKLLALLISLVVGCGLAVVPVAAAQAVVYSAVPGQFMAKIYTEGLGRAPDALAWDNMQNYYIANGCSVSTLTTHGAAVLKSAEFATAYPIPDTTTDHQTLAARAIVLYRTGLNRDPSTTDLANVVAAQVASQTTATWNSLVDTVFASAEFSDLAKNSICSGASWERDPSAYYWNNQIDPARVSAPVDSRCGLSNITQSQLQTVLNATSSGGVVKLAQGAMIVIDGAPTGTGTFGGGLRVPPGVTLTTCAAGDAAGLKTPTPNNYATMARFVRAWTAAGGTRATFTVFTPGSTTNVDFSKSAMIRVADGGKVSRIWIDGNANVPESYCEGCGNIMTLGGSGTSVSESKIGNGSGSSQLQTVGLWNKVLSANPDVLACTGTNYVQGNLVTAYNSAHHAPAANSSSAGGGQATWTDGFNIGCEKTEVSGNTIVDATDVSLIVFRSCVQNEASSSGPVCTTGPGRQESDVHDNTILNAGQSAYGALMVSPFDSAGPDPVANFNGFTMNDNQMWTSVAAHINTGIIAGVRPYTYADTARRGTGATSTGANGASITGNTTNGQIAYVGNAALVSGLLKFTVSGNSLSLMETAGPGYGGVPSTGYYSSSGATDWVCPTTAVNSSASMIAETYFGTTTPANYWASGTIATTGTTPLSDQALYYVVGTQKIGCMLGGINGGL
jgi:hypothetical protein